MKSKTVKIGLTGAMGSGKSAVGAAFKELGANVVDCDLIAKNVLENDLSARRKIIALLGDEAFIEGVANKAYIAKKVFEDSALLCEYEKILHPEIIAQIEKSLKTGAINLIEIPLLYESRSGTDFKSMLDMVCAVFCSESVRKSRLISRGLTLPEIIARDANQMSGAKKAELADTVFFNDGSREFLKTQIEIFLNRLGNL